MSAGDIKTYNIVYPGLELEINVIDIGGGQVRFEIKCVTGSADVNAIYHNDGVPDGNSTSLAGPLNMNGSGVDWDGAIKLSDPGLGKAGWDKPTALTAGESYVFDTALNWSTLDDLGIRATSTSTAEGSIKGVDGSAEVTYAPKLSVADAACVIEGNASVFTISLEKAYDYDVYVTYSTHGGTATEGDDYSGLVNAVVKIPAGSTSIDVQVATVDDAAVESEEHFSLKIDSVRLDIPGADIESATAYTVDGTAEGCIQDNDTSNGGGGDHPEFYGLSKGFWGNSNGLQDWDLNKNASFEATFGVDRDWDTEAPYNKGPTVSDLSLLEALNVQGGGQNQLASQAVAALLNASDEDLNYKYTKDQVISMVKDAFDGGSGWTVDGLAAEFEYWNAHAGPNDEGHTYAQSVNHLVSNA
ncbi:hypothetical protein ASE61_09075 [Bosea sp. Root670]|uniref:Calx-beta domain-containing protein n=1 Tax=Bosea sp. Root670 TaxID=1736583 RepID=UPI0007163704|nr:Calx-beta domain-containing protein [Bosea sp. Root670]KRE03774.1 hypothetical protein ASE61_09075 [Bosea sp. Root670]